MDWHCIPTCQCNAELKEIYESEYKRVDSALNEVYGILKENLPKDQFAVLQNQQRAWLSNLNKSKEERLAMGGSSAGVDVMYDMAVKTQERTLEWLYKYFGFKPVY